MPVQVQQQHRGARHEIQPARILYNLDAGGGGQGIEFTPEGDKLFVGSSIANRIEVFDVIGDFELRKTRSS